MERGGFQADSSSYHQPSSYQEQLAEREQREEPGTVFGQPPVAGLHMAELAFVHAEGMLVGVPQLYQITPKVADFSDVP